MNKYCGPAWLCHFALSSSAWPRCPQSRYLTSSSTLSALLRPPGPSTGPCASPVRGQGSSASGVKGTNLALTPKWPRPPMTGGAHAPTQADPPSCAGAAGHYPRGRVPAALAVPGAAGPGVRAGSAGAGRPHAEPAAGGLRAGLVRRRDGGHGHAGGTVGGERVRRPAAHRALPEPPLRGHALVPGPDVPRRRTDLRPAGRGRRAAIHRGGGGRPADPAGDRAQPGTPGPGTPSCWCTSC